MKRKPSERTLFERWAMHELSYYPAQYIRSLRTAEGGYEHRTLDFAWMGWQARAEQARNDLQTPLENYIGGLSDNSSANYAKT
jgi:hypothetical protein